jgi:sugar/nucleoside kinase (ribokinase family)
VRVAAVDLVTAGEAFEDLIFVGLPRLPRLGEELKTSTFVRTLGGGVLITAVAAARLGTRCRVVSGLSPAATDLLRRERIRATDLRRHGEPHAVSAALSTPHNRTFVTFNGVNDHLEQRLLRGLARVAARHVHFAFYPRACARWRTVIRALRRRGVTTSWDFGWNEALAADPVFPQLVGELDYLMVNEQEATLYSRTRGLSQAVRFWKQQTRATILKLGPRGSRWLASDLDIAEPAPRVRVVDSTGAGDAFNGGFLAARLAGRSPRASLRAGNRIGAQSTRAPGGIAGLPRPRQHP